VAWDHDEGSSHETPVFQFLEQQAGHDGFAGAGVVGKQEADTRIAQDIVVNRFNLVRQRIYLRNAYCKKGIKLMGITDALRLHRKEESFTPSTEVPDGLVDYAHML
jgi:hypothetical protein